MLSNGGLLRTLSQPSSQLFFHGLIALGVLLVIGIPVEVVGIGRTHVLVAVSFIGIDRTGIAVIILAVNEIRHLLLLRGQLQFGVD